MMQRVFTVAGREQEGRSRNCLGFTRWHGGMSGRRNRHTLATVSGPVLRGGMVSVGTMKSRCSIIRIEDGLVSSTRHFGSGHTTLQWFSRRGGRAC